MDRRSKRKVFLVDAHVLMRELLSQFINAQDDLAVCGATENIGEALTKIRSLKPDIVITNLAFKHAHGLDLIKDLRIRHPKLPILVLTMQDESFFAERVLRAGAHGYITTKEPVHKVLSAVRQVLTQGMYVSERLAAKIVRRSLDTPEGGGSLFEALSDRELQVFQLMGKGCGTQQIAKALSLGVRTVNTYRSRIKEKLGLESSAALMRQAVQWSGEINALRPPLAKRRDVSDPPV
jgi:DNA-binding NarL/FixJ family response regulator